MAGALKQVAGCDHDLLAAFAALPALPPSSLKHTATHSHRRCPNIKQSQAAWTTMAQPSNKTHVQDVYQLKLSLTLEFP